MDYDFVQDYPGQPSRPKKSRKFRGPKSKAAKILVNLLVTAILGFLYFYFALPSINLHDSNFYVFIGFLCVVYFFSALITSGMNLKKEDGPKAYFQFIKTQCLPIGILFAALIVVAIIGAIISAPLFRAGDYRDLLQVENGNFTEDIAEASFDEIPLLDESSAMRLGTTQMGMLSDMASQFEVAQTYTQINYQQRPVRVTYLEYGDFFKWLNNRGEGLPAYITIDMVTSQVDVVRLSSLGTGGMKYSPSELFNRNLFRHLRFHYPTYMFATPTFEIDDNGHPWWICSRISKTIGLFGGEDIIGAVLVDAVTGESTYYELEDVPTWVDRVFSASLIMNQYDYHGLYVNGFFNSIFGQKDVTKTTDNFNYLAMNDDVFMYTGVTSVTSDQSNLGFLLCNQRTKETKFYQAPGATEAAAQRSAEGEVQDLGYTATFPLLLNVAGEPTYFMSLKDSSYLVKMYAMVNVAQYTAIVATGTTVAECESNYLNLLASKGITEEEVLPQTDATGAIAEIRSAVLDGTSYYFLRLEGEEVFYSISAASFPEVVVLNVGDTVTIEHQVLAEGQTASILDGYSLSRAGSGATQPPAETNPVPETPPVVSTPTP